MNPEYKTRAVLLDPHKSMAVSEIHELAAMSGFPKKALGEIDLIVSELASNHIKHNTVQGRIRYRVDDGGDGRYIEIISEDNGPGIPDCDIAFEDGFTTAAKSMGVGLGSIRRVSDEFDISSSLSGTRIRVKKYAEKRIPIHGNGLRISVLTRPHPFESVCGDGYYVERFRDGALIAVIDGLGHGVHAREAASCAERYLRNNARHARINDLLAGLGSVLRKTRGAVAGIIRIDEEQGKIYYSGIGDTSVRLYQGESYNSFHSIPGILGVNYTQVQIQSGDWIRGRSMAILHSDGISSRFSLDYAMAGETPQLIAHYIMDKYWREIDDGTVIVVK
ncbi:SpoIIE family protein phosphatase [Methanocalculus taiwanensis]|uniref:SpoIIE family protein phosphatase n=1 Tax=Methanocalculus taiwanensis TaxID=106207 RepID=A0ABD4TJ55_9EURY|nr:ATP-binding protein [Methanocalculus taiwanensis]MCQ1538791.1 SpoIIE family protein phosphatase [Methanocalculus taiwanensis]